MKGSLAGVFAAVMAVSAFCGGSGSGTAVTWNPVAFHHLDFEPDTAAFPTAELEVFETEADFIARFGRAPAGVDWASEWVAWHTTGALPVPGHTTEITRVQVTSSGQTLEVATEQVQPDATCQQLLLERPAHHFVVLPAQTAVTQIQHRPTNLPWRCDAHGVGADIACHDNLLCGSDLVCAGVTRMDKGTCRPAEHRGRDTVSIATALDAGATTVVNFRMTDLASVDEDVVIDLELTHPSPADLTITLENPSGNVVDVWTGEAHAGGTFRINRAPVGFSGDEDVNGLWQLLVVNDGPAGTLHAGTLEVTSRWD